MKNYVIFGKDMHDKLMKGIKILYDAVSNTIGASGKNATFRRQSIPMVTNDGISKIGRAHV